MDAVTPPIADDAPRVALSDAPRVAWIDGAVAVVVAGLLVWGWRGRADPALDPHGWAGWWLGLTGALMMLAVLGFSWRKRVATGPVSVAGWYNVHVLLGLFGPVLVVFHARFAWGSINSSFALVAMALVVISGLLARYALPLARRRGGPMAGALVEGWHYLHLPLYAVLVLAVIVHVYMAHAY
jgi:hypothetical protein